MISRKKASMVVSIVILIGSILFLTAGCDRGGGSASNPVVSTGSGGITGALYQDRNVQLASAGLIEQVWIALAQNAKDLLSVSVAHAAVQLNLSNSSPSSGILVELLLNGTVVASTITGPNGKFDFGGLAAGDYILRFTKDPDLLIETTISVKEGAITEIEGKITVASTSGNVHLMMEVEKHREVDHYFEHEKKESEKKKNHDLKKEKKKKDKDDDDQNDNDDDNDQKKVS